MPNVNISFSLPKDWSYSLRIEGREVLFRGVYGEQFGAAPRHERIVVQQTVLHKVSPYASVGGVYTLQHVPAQSPAGSVDWSHRIGAQYVHVRKQGRVRVSHRAFVEHTFANARLLPAPRRWDFRFRYRFLTELPLQGDAVDVGEWYLRQGIENIFTVAAQATVDNETRLLAFAGFQIGKQHKVEMGFDYRISRLFVPARVHQGWLQISYFYSGKI